jgi:gamma-glutamylcyclotransferase (GGCT)/AIG2-like uncharacterized protein YtfP
MTNLFIYGTLQEPRIQEYLFGKTIEMIPARLQFYTIKNAISDGIELPYKTIVAVPDDSTAVVDGHIIILNDAQMERVDAYEGYPTLYLRTHVVVEDSDNIVQQCISYINTPYFFNQNK